MELGSAGLGRAGPGPGAGTARHGKLTQDKGVFIDYRCGTASRGTTGRGNVTQDKDLGDQQMQMQKSADTKIIESVLGDAKVGQVITYDQLSQAIGRDVRAHAIGALGTARRGLLSEKGYVFDVERNVGLVRLDDVGIVKTTESDRRRLQRCANKSLRKLAVVQFDKLDDNNKRQHVVASAQMGTIAMFASKASANKIESQVNGQSKTLAIGETIKLFS